MLAWKRVLSNEVDDPVTETVAEAFSDQFRQSVTKFERPVFLRLHSKIFPSTTRILFCEIEQIEWQRAAP